LHQQREPEGSLLVFLRHTARIGGTLLNLIGDAAEEVLNDYLLSEVIGIPKVVRLKR
jgi:hypothetical protein